MFEQQRGDLSGLIRDRVAAGILPKDAPVKVWVGPGTGKLCDACGLPTTGMDREYETDMSDGRSFRWHQPCFALWHQERATYLQP